MSARDYVKLLDEIKTLEGAVAKARGQTEVSTHQLAKVREGVNKESKELAKKGPFFVKVDETLVYCTQTGGAVCMAPFTEE